MGEYAHINVRVPEGESVTVNWGDGQSTTHSGRSIESFTQIHCRNANL